MFRYFFAILIFVLTTRIAFHYLFLDPLPEGTVRIEGTISSPPLLYERKQRIEVERYKIYLPSYPQLSYGDRVVLEGIAKAGTIEDATLITHVPNSNFLSSFRKTLLSFYSSHLPTNEAALVSGVVVGSKELLTKEFWDQLTYTGTAHVVVASGMNIAIVSKFVMGILLVFAPRKKAIPGALLFIWFYVTLVGFEAPIIRAAIMGSLTFVLQETGKLGDAIKSIFYTSFAMLMWKPEWIVDVSFLLSFFATLSLILLTKPIERKIKAVPQVVRSDLSTSLAASIGTAPILFFAFGRVNVLSPLINTLILWTIVPITILGGLAGLVGIVVPEIGTLLLVISFPFMWWFTSIVSLLS